MIKKRINEATLYFFLISTLFLTYWKIWNYPFIQDDWSLLYLFENINDNVTLLKMFFAFKGQFFYRPLGQLYLFLMHKLFALNPIPYHLIALCIHLANANFVILIFKKMLTNNLVAWGTGFLYIAASSLYLDPLLWIVGIYDLGGMFFFLLSVWLFLNNRVLLSAVCYLISLLFKSSTIVLPLILISYIVFTQYKPNNKHFSKKIKPLGVYLLPFIIYLFIKSQGVSPLSLTADNPYKIDLWGVHLFKNIRLYSVWAFQALFPYPLPFVNISNLSYTLILLFILGLLTVWLIIYFNKTTKAIQFNLKCLVFLFGWIVLALLPIIFMPNHSYRYYLTISFPAIAASFLLLLNITLSYFGTTKETKYDIVMLIISFCLLSSVYHFHRVDAEGLFQHRLADGTNYLISRGTAVKIVEKQLPKTHPTLPPNAVIIFSGVDILSFGKDYGPRIWYNNNTLKVYSASYLKSDSTGTYLDSPPENQVEVFTGGKEQKIYLDPSKTFYYSLE